MIWVAKVDLYAEQTFQLFVSFQEEVVVSCDGFHLRKALLDFQKCFVDIGNVNGNDSFKKRDSCFSVNDYQQYAFAAFAGYYEVGFRISQSLPFIYVFGPFIDECSVQELGEFGSSSVSSLFAFFAMVFNPSSINAFDVAVDAVFGNIGKFLFLISKPACYCSRRLIIVEMPVNKLFERFVADNLHSLVLGVFSPCVSLVLGFSWVVFSFHAVMRNLVRKSGN